MTMAERRKLRVLWLNWYDLRNPRAGGAEVHLHDVASRLCAMGHEVTVVATGWAGGGSVERYGGVVVRRVGRWWCGHQAVPWLARRLLRREAFDVVIDGVNKVPFEAPRWAKVPVLALFLHLVGETAYRDFPRPLATWYLRRERRILEVYGETPSVTISECTKSELVAFGLKEELVRVIPPGIDREMYRPPAVRESRSGLRVLMVSRLRKYKRIDLGLRAIAALQGQGVAVSAVIVGSGPADVELRALARDLGLHAEFLGAVDDQRKIAEMQRADILLAPSEKEGFGLTCIEAMACGAKVVATDVPGHRSAVLPFAGVLADADPLALADAMLRVVGEERWTSKALERVEALDHQAIAQAWVALLEELASRHIKTK